MKLQAVSCSSSILFVERICGEESKDDKIPT